MGSLSLLQGIFPTQESNPGLPHCRQILYELSHKGSPRILGWVAFTFSSGSSQPRNQTWVSCIAGGFFTNWAVRNMLWNCFLINCASLYSNWTACDNAYISVEDCCCLFTNHVWLFCNPMDCSRPGASGPQRSLAGYSPWGFKSVRHNFATKQQQRAMWVEKATLVGLWLLLKLFPSSQPITLISANNS